MTQFRIAWEPCPDCGRSSMRPGGCYVVERRGWFGWKPYLVTFDRGGREQAEHFNSIESARQAYMRSTEPQPEKEAVLVWNRP